MKTSIEILEMIRINVPNGHFVLFNSVYLRRVYDEKASAQKNIITVLHSKGEPLLLQIYLHRSKGHRTNKQKERSNGK